MHSYKFSCNFSWAGARYSLETSLVSIKDKLLTHLTPFSFWHCFVDVKLQKAIFFPISTRKTQGQKNKGEGGGKKSTYCFLRHVIGLTLLALKLCMMDPSPSTHCWKTPKHQISTTEKGEVGKLGLGEGSSLKPWVMLITCARSQPIPWKRCELISSITDPPPGTGTVLSIPPNATCGTSRAINQ